MSNYKVKSSFEDWSPDVSSLADRLLIGPQRELLEKVQNLNNRYALNLNITRTYRWSPGYMVKIKEFIVNRYIETHMNRKISTFFNQIDNKQWIYSNLKRQLNDIDNKMSEKRRVRSVFQDNTNLIEDRWEIFHKILTGNLIKCKLAFDDIRIKVEIVENDVGQEHISITWYFPPGDMNIFVGQQAFPITMGRVEINCMFKLDTIVMNLCGDRTTFTEDSEGNESINMDNVTGGNSYNIFCGWYDERYTSNCTDHELKHPFISAWNSIIRVMDGESFKNICLGDLSGRIWNELQRFDFVAMTLTLMQWNSTYNSRNTRPLNNITNSFWGLPKRVNHPDFIAVYGDDPTNCGYKDRNGEMDPGDWSAEYCEDIDCALKDRCNHYLTVMGEPLVDRNVPIEEVFPDMEVEANMVREEETLEEYRRIAEENGDLDSPDLPLDPDELEEMHVPVVGEEAVIAWAAQNGGNLINIRGEQ